MVNNQARGLSLGEAATQYLAKLSSKEKDSHQPEVYKFARWCGWESPFSRLSGPAVAGYAEQLSVSDTDYARRLELVRAFLAYARKAGWSPTNLGGHLKTKKGKTGPAVAAVSNRKETVTLTS